jgi:ABC-type glycerol-3-phosphate transport system substrate-binding protein
MRWCKSFITIGVELVLTALISGNTGSLQSIPLVRASTVEQAAAIDLRIWWPDALYSENAAETLEAQFSAFRSAYITVNLDIRYREYEVGESFHRLSLTREVAPGALPHLTLMQRDDVVAAVNADLIRPLDGWVPPVIMSELAPNLLALGQVDGKLYGLPYLLTVEHMIYLSSPSQPAPNTFDAFLAQETPLLFPGAPVGGFAVNDLVLIQYLAAGGYLVDDNGAPALDETAMQTVLEFYADSLQSAVFRPALEQVLDYRTPQDYWPRIIAGSAMLALVDSSAYLQNRDRLPSGVSTPPPLTADGERFTLLDGWMWVLLADDQDRQTQARNFLSWMMGSDNLTDTATRLGMLPSQQRALRVMSDDEYVDAMSVLLETAYFVPPEQRKNEAAVALQAAFVSVLDGADPGEATTVALETLQQ